MFSSEGSSTQLIVISHSQLLLAHIFCWWWCWQCIFLLFVLVVDHSHKADFSPPIFFPCTDASNHMICMQANQGKPIAHIATQKILNCKTPVNHNCLKMGLKIYSWCIGGRACFVEGRDIWMVNGNMSNATSKVSITCGWFMNINLIWLSYKFYFGLVFQMHNISDSWSPLQSEVKWFSSPLTLCKKLRQHVYYELIRIQTHAQCAWWSALATHIQGNQFGSTCYYHVSLLQQFWNGKMQVYLSLEIQVVIQYKLLLANQLNPNPFAIAMPIISTVIWRSCCPNHQK
jgi:hypothetical protein